MCDNLRVLAKQKPCIDVLSHVRCHNGGEGGIPKEIPIGIGNYVSSEIAYSMSYTLNSGFSEMCVHVYYLSLFSERLVYFQLLLGPIKDCTEWQVGQIC